MRLGLGGRYRRDDHKHLPPANQRFQQRLDKEKQDRAEPPGPSHFPSSPAVGVSGIDGGRISVYGTIREYDSAKHDLQ